MQNIMEFLNTNSNAIMVIITFVYVVATIFIYRANKTSADLTRKQLEESKRQFVESSRQAKEQLEESIRQFDESSRQEKKQLEETKRQFDESSRQAKEQLEESKRQFDESMIHSKEYLKESQKQYEESLRLQCLPFLQIEPLTEDLSNYNFMLNLPLHNGNPDDTIVKVFALKNLGNGTALNLIYNWKCKKYNISNCGMMPFCAIRAGDSYNIRIEFDIEDFDGSISSCIQFEYTDLLGQFYTQKVFIIFPNEAGNFECENDLPKLLDKEYIGI